MRTKIYWTYKCGHGAGKTTKPCPAAERSGTECSTRNWDVQWEEYPYDCPGYTSDTSDDSE